MGGKTLSMISSCSSSQAKSNCKVRNHRQLSMRHNNCSEQARAAEKQRLPRRGATVVGR